MAAPKRLIIIQLVVFSHSDPERCAHVLNSQQILKSVKKMYIQVVVLLPLLILPPVLEAPIVSQLNGS